MIRPDDLASTAAGRAMALAATRGRRVMLAILSLIMVVPVVNLSQIMKDGVPEQFQYGQINYAYATGMFFSVILVLFWYYAYVGRRRPRIVLGLVYLTATAIIVPIPSLMYLLGQPMVPGWMFGVGFAAVYGLVGWVLLFSDNIKAFQRHQIALRQPRAPTPAVPADAG